MVSFDYLSSEDENYLKRDVIPIRIIFWNRNLYLIAYSYSRQDYRTYRIDRISGDVDLGESADLDLESEATGKFKEFISNLDSSLKCLVTLKGNAVFRSVENNYIKISAVGDSVEISYPEREITDLFKVLLRNIENIQDLETADVFTKFKQYVNRINDVQF
jgi:predicted DNA-binding transcriptional regulator YafY